MFSTTPAVTVALANLLRAHEYAEELDADLWKFAIEWRLLKARGLEEVDVRYLVARGLVELRREISLPAAFIRTFVAYDVPRLSRDTAFILTPQGAAYCRNLIDGSDASVPSSSSHHTTDSSSGVLADVSATSGSTLKPHWHPDRRELTFGGQIVKRYRVPSPNQELILSIFQEEEWPEFIDDPLPPAKDVDCITRLQATVKSLNRTQVTKLIRFSGNGGKKVIWSAVKKA